MKNLPDDPGKTWVPDERDQGFLAETEEASGPSAEISAETDTGSLGALSQSSDSSGEDKSKEPKEPPRQFGEYELLQQVGRGGMGNVYKAHHRRLDRIVALKTLRAGSARTERQVERFVREAKATARLDHPNIVPCYESGQFGDWHYLTMAFVTGESLQDRIERGPLEPEEAARLVLALTGAISHAHKQGVVHRDIKPGNVILSEDGRPRLTDFGIAKLIDVGDSFSASSQITLVGQVLGTPGFMAPEQSAGRRWEVGRSADIYGLGGLLNAALTGRLPTSDNAVATLAPTIPEDLKSICDRCLAHNPQDRFSSADRLVSALEKYLKRISTPEVQAAPPPADPVLASPAVAGSKFPSPGFLKALGFVAAVLACSLLLASWFAGWWNRPASPNVEATPLQQESQP